MNAAKGAYVLLIYLDAASCITIGRFGTHRFPRGWYLYVGSAYGPGGLSARLSRHGRRDKRRHWHIDYLLDQALLEGNWTLHALPKVECALAATLAREPGFQILVPRFGASDCRCEGHLIYTPSRPDPLAIESVLQGIAEGVRRSCG